MRRPSPASDAVPLDQALPHPGRFDCKRVVDAPRRREIVEYYPARMRHEPAIPVDVMASEAIGYTPLAVRRVINEAVIHAHFDARHRKTYVDFISVYEPPSPRTAPFEPAPLARRRTEPIRGSVREG